MQTAVLNRNKETKIQTVGKKWKELTLSLDNKQTVSAFEVVKIVKNNRVVCLFSFQMLSDTECKE